MAYSCYEDVSGVSGLINYQNLPDAIIAVIRGIFCRGRAELSGQEVKWKWKRHEAGENSHGKRQQKREYQPPFFPCFGFPAIRN